MGSRPTQAQMEALVEFLEENTDIAKGFLRTQHARHETKRKWSEASVAINALGGVTKDGRGWSKYWAEKKCALKKLCAQHAQSIRRTGGGTQQLPNLSPLDLRLVAVMGGETFATGDSQLSVDPFPHRTQSLALQREGQQTSEPSTSQIEVIDMAIVEEVEVQVESQDTMPPLAAHGSQRRQSGGRQSEGRRLQSQQLQVQLDRFQDIEDRRVQAELCTAQALADIATGIESFGNSVRESAQVIANALLEIARRMPSPPAQ